MNLLKCTKKNTGPIVPTLTAGTQSTFSSIGSGLVGSCLVGSNTLTLYAGTSGYLYGRVTGGAETLLVSYAVNGNFLSVVATSTSSAIVIFASTNGVDVRYLTISGTSITVAAGGAQVSTTSGIAVSVCNLSSTYSIVSYDGPSNGTLKMRLITHTASAISTVGAEVDMGVEALSYTPILVAVSSTTALVTYTPYINPNWIRAVRIITLSGTTLSTGTTTTVATDNGGSVPAGISVLDSASQKFILAYLTATTIAFRVLTVSGSTVTVGAVSSVDRSSNFYPIAVVGLSSTLAYIGYINAGAGYILYPLGISSYTITVGLTSIDLYNGGTVGKICMNKLTATSAYCAFYNGGNTCLSNVVTAA